MVISGSIKQIQQKRRILTTLEKHLKAYRKIDKKTFDAVSQADKLLEKIQNELGKLHETELISTIRTFIETETKENTELYAQLERVFGNNLNNELKKNNLTLDGRLPKIRVGYYGLEISFQKNECKIYFGINEELISKTKLDPHNIVKEILDLETKLEKTKLDPSILLKSYQTVLASNRREAANRVQIIKLLIQVTIDLQSTKFTIDPIQKNYREYSRIQFSHDLFKLKRDKTMKIRLITANRGQVRNKLDYLWIPNSPTKGSVYSSIEIVEAS